jgi:hypothetical protein
VQAGGNVCAFEQVSLFEAGSGKMVLSHPAHRGITLLQECTLSTSSRLKIWGRSEYHNPYVISGIVLIVNGGSITQVLTGNVYLMQTRKLWI